MRSNRKTIDLFGQVIASISRFVFNILNFFYMFINVLVCLCMLLLVLDRVDSMTRPSSGIL